MSQTFLVPFTGVDEYAESLKPVPSVTRSQTNAHITSLAHGLRVQQARPAFARLPSARRPVLEGLPRVLGVPVPGSLKWKYRMAKHQLIISWLIIQQPRHDVQQ